MTSEGHRILLVDDNIDGAVMMGELVKMMGYEVQVEYDGAKGIETAKNWKPDVVILDIGMPFMNGYEVASRLRHIPETKHAKIIALTGLGRMEAENESGLEDFDRHLVRPVDFDKLEQVLHETIEH